MGPCQVVGVVRCGFNVIAVVIMQCMLIHIQDRNVPHHTISLFIATQKATFFLFNVIHQVHIIIENQDQMQLFCSIY